MSGAYTDNWTYSQIGNINTHNGTSYAYGSKPHAVTQVGSANYTYDANGNMLTRPNGSITWDMENRPVSMTVNGVTTNFTYDGDGNRVKQAITGGNTTLYINKYYEKNLTSGNVTSYYYLGGRLVAMKQSSANVTYIHQDSLSGTSVMSTSSGTLDSSINYTPFGLTRSGSVPTDIKFTGQRLDTTGLYYYGARYYDPTIGRFISPDTFMLSPANPQGLNRYSYVFNNPLRYNDPTGNWPPFLDQAMGAIGRGAEAVREGLVVAVNKSVEFYFKVGDAVDTGMGTVNRVVGEGGERFQNTMNALPNIIGDAVGVEGVKTMNTSLSQDVPLIDVRQDSILDNLLFFTDVAVTLYPLGTFEKVPLDIPSQEHEGYHWNEQKSFGPFLPLWYSNYTSEYVVDLVLYGFDTYAAHEANSFEQEAYRYPPASGTGADPGPPWDYWDWWPW